MQSSKKVSGQQKKKKETTKENEKGFESLVDALKALDPKELKAELNDVQNRCPDAPSVGGIHRGSWGRRWGRCFQPPTPTAKKKLINTN